ncbi:hypothetical protein P9J64_06910 [Deltaproteobacteria bacterium IMCC39524]|nr:hypothetical protein [Deltaproteobacteria bacterium IMCC39524]
MSSDFIYVELNLVSKAALQVALKQRESLLRDSLDGAWMRQSYPPE